MIKSHSATYKKRLFFLIICCASLVGAYGIFVSIVSIWVGIHHINLRGSLVPIVSGLGAIPIILWILVSIIKACIRHIKKADLLDT